MGLFKKIRCEICQKRFFREEQAMNHMQLVHGDRMYDCRECGMYFPSMEDMRNHIQKVHSYKRG